MRESQKINDNSTNVMKNEAQAFWHKADICCFTPNKKIQAHIEHLSLLHFLVLLGKSEKCSRNFIVHRTEMIGTSDVLYTETRRTNEHKVRKSYRKLCFRPKNLHHVL